MSTHWNQLWFSPVSDPGKCCSLHISPDPVCWKRGRVELLENENFLPLEILELMNLLSLLLLLVIFGFHDAFAQLLSSQSIFNLRHLLLAQLL